MRLAIIDLGTNSIRFDVHEISASRTGFIQSRRLYREKIMVRLGQDLFVSGQLSQDGKRRTLESIESFHETMDALKVNKTIAFGTSAVRDASDGEQFIQQIRKQTGVDFRIISGAEEASLIAKGIIANESIPKGMTALIDIGGGSAEVSICKGAKVLHSYSFNLGVARLQQVFLKTQPPLRKSKKDPDPIQELRNYIKSVVLPKMIVERWPKVDRIVGSSGSIIALSKLAHKGNEGAGKTPFDLKALSRLVDSMKTKNTAGLLSMSGMEPKRVDLILAGAILLDELAQLLGAKTIHTTEFSLRDGILVDELARFKLKSDQATGFSLDEMIKRTEHWGIDAKHFQNVRLNSEWLFDHLSRIHGLKKSWRQYLSAAAILHDVGETISHANHPEHSEYIVKNANFVGVHPWESQLIASLCRFHKDEKILDKKNERKIPYPKGDELRPIFLKLLALLQLSDALDRGHKGQVKLKTAKILPGKVGVFFNSKHTCDLEFLRFEQKKVLFEQVFKREITLHKR